MIQHYGRVIDHVHLRVRDLSASRTFYRAICDALCLQDAWREDDDHFSIDEIYVDAASDYVSKVHLAFQARSHEEVDAFHAAAVAAGGTSNGGPGFRPYHDRYYAAFVFDPDGNNIEAVCDGPTKRSAASVISQRI
ncbi:catechol 2,3-dioxygenase-like lactoylglutathione lyase family enzyme [Rhizobium sp. BK650]|uniref:VOC family protein n=1 Tax=Rhizobium sp. BK650 TaxID=2586990 RepID=UPI0016082B71|nr:VOC family protein [Rhizobium sp. BK650]MBB3659992.1 catechol 2,3-dioxygenase-like lactoylglutathione lyase family enzyme [Rhizobium sp. BK650]